MNIGTQSKIQIKVGKRMEYCIGGQNTYGIFMNFRFTRIISTAIFESSIDLLLLLEIYQCILVSKCQLNINKLNTINI